MNYLRKFLKNNVQLEIVHNKVFNYGPMTIDHLAHRTFKNDNVSGTYARSHNFFKLQNNRYNFKTHNAYAEWWDYTCDKFDNEYINSLHMHENSIIGTPKLFISTYAGKDCDKNLVNSDIDFDQIEWHINNPNGLMSYTLYEKINEKNPYLAWTLVHRNNVNHIGIEVEDIDMVANRVAQFLPLNSPDAPIQVSEDGDLLQFSTKSTILPFKFEEGSFEIPYNFVEFIERKNNRKGFSEKNANVVFNSTTQ